MATPRCVFVRCASEIGRIPFVQNQAYRVHRRRCNSLQSRCRCTPSHRLPLYHRRRIFLTKSVVRFRTQGLLLLSPGRLSFLAPLGTFCLTHALPLGPGTQRARPSFFSNAQLSALDIDLLFFSSSGGVASGVRSVQGVSRVAAAPQHDDGRVQAHLFLGGKSRFVDSRSERAAHERRTDHK